MAEQTGFWDDISGFFKGAYDTVRSGYGTFIDGVKTYNEGQASIELSKAQKSNAERVAELERGSTASTGYDPSAPANGYISQQQNTLVLGAIGLVALGLILKK